MEVVTSEKVGSGYWGIVFDAVVPDYRVDVDKAAT